jgi:hypothetical protein
VAWGENMRWEAEALVWDGLTMRRDAGSGRIMSLSVCCGRRGRGARKADSEHLVVELSLRPVGEL